MRLPDRTSRQPSNGRRTLSWAIPLLLFIGACAAIYFQPEYSVATARVMIENASASPTGYAIAHSSDLAGQNRNAPVDWTIRLTSFASIRAALEYLNRDSDALESTLGKVHARIVPGSTVIEVNVREKDSHAALTLLDAVLHVQDELWIAPLRQRTAKVLEGMTRQEAQINQRRAEAALQIQQVQENQSLGLTGSMFRLQSALAQLAVEGARVRAEASQLQRDGDPTGANSMLLSGENRSEIARIKAEMDQVRVQLAGRQAVHGEHHREVAELRARLNTLQERETFYKASEMERLVDYMQVVHTATSDVHSFQADVMEEILQNRAIELSEAGVGAAATIDVATTQLERLLEERNRLQLFRESLVSPLVILDPPSVRADYHARMKAAQYATAAMGALFLAGALWIIFPVRRAGEVDGGKVP